MKSLTIGLAISLVAVFVFAVFCMVRVAEMEAEVEATMLKMARVAAVAEKAMQGDGPEIGGAESPILEIEPEYDFVFPIHPDNYMAVSSAFGRRVSPVFSVLMHHDGVDILAPRFSQILAAADGVVVSNYPAPGTPVPQRPGVYYKGHPVMGTKVRIDHGDGIESVYGHMSVSYVHIGMHVRAGDVIGRLGNTGIVSGRNGGFHLHFEVRVDGKSVDPFIFVPDPEIVVVADSR